MDTHVRTLLLSKVFSFCNSPRDFVNLAMVNRHAFFLGKQCFPRIQRGKIGVIEQQLLSFPHLAWHQSSSPWLTAELVRKYDGLFWDSSAW